MQDAQLGQRFAVADSGFGLCEFEFIGCPHTGFKVLEVLSGKTMVGDGWPFRHDTESAKEFSDRARVSAEDSREVLCRECAGFHRAPPLRNGVARSRASDIQLSRDFSHLSQSSFPGWNWLRK